MSVLSDTSSVRAGVFLALADNFLPVWHMLIINWALVEQNYSMVVIITKRCELCAIPPDTQLNHVSLVAI